MAAGLVQSFSGRTLLRPVLLRAAFIPAFLLCAVDGSKLPSPLSGDAWPELLLAAFGLTNGYLSSLAMMYGPSSVDPNEVSALAYIF